MTASNRLSRLVGKFDRWPIWLRRELQTRALGSKVPFVGTARLRVEELSHQRVVVSVRNRRRVQNHLQGVHAAAMALLVETATGFAVGMHLPDDRLPLLKSLKVEYAKRARGGLQARVELDSEHVQSILSQTKGSLSVPVTVTDESGRVPIRCEVVWAWIPRDRPPAPGVS